MPSKCQHCGMPMTGVSNKKEVDTQLGKVPVMVFSHYECRWCWVS